MLREKREKKEAGGERWGREEEGNSSSSNKPGTRPFVIVTFNGSVLIVASIRSRTAIINLLLTAVGKEVIRPKMEKLEYQAVFGLLLSVFYFTIFKVPCRPALTSRRSLKTGWQPYCLIHPHVQGVVNVQCPPSCWSAPSVSFQKPRLSSLFFPSNCHA